MKNGVYEVGDRVVRIPFGEKGEVIRASHRQIEVRFDHTGHTIMLEPREVRQQ